MSKSVRIILVSFLLLTFVSLPAEAARKRQAKPVLSAKAAFVWNVTQDKVYFSKNADQRIYPASTTKVMTVLLALENLPLDQYVTVSQRATEAAPSKLYLRAGEEYKVRDLIYACLLKSANDAAGVLAEAVGGTQEQFVSMMNKRALDIGARNTRFINPSGLPGKGSQFTTARDMALILREALKNPFFEKAITYPHQKITSKIGRNHWLKSHNKILFSRWKQKIYGKTGYTLQAKSCFVGYMKKGNDMLIVDVFGCRTNKRWNDLKWLVERYGRVDV
jgi:serine-type D-Ala-D-Ala carboxypeptidase (penicillin-binding protein 5/6)